MNTKLEATSVAAVAIAELPVQTSIIDEGAIIFLRDLHRAFEVKRKGLLADRNAAQAKRNRGVMPSFLPETKHIREGSWSCSPPPPYLEDRRVEITAPADRKMMINGLNSGANVLVADFEDANTPTWSNMINGQVNLYDAYRNGLTFESAGKSYRVSERPAHLFMRPRGIHLDERHIKVDNCGMSGMLFDLGLHSYLNAKIIVESGHSLCIYIPKTQTHQEARFVNEVCSWIEEKLQIPTNSILVATIVETLPAVFEMDEILYELRNRTLGMNAGRWDFIFSLIKSFRYSPEWILPDRSAIEMNTPMMRAFTQFQVQTCHRRGTFAMGGMSAFIPVKGDATANDAAFAEVRRDKLREVRDGNDGTWVAHPALVPVALEVFENEMSAVNQIHIEHFKGLNYKEEQLLTKPIGVITREGLRECIQVAIEYLGSWLHGTGAVAIQNKMEDVATAEISRALVWQWLHHEVTLEDGSKVDKVVIKSEVENVIGIFASSLYDRAAELFLNMTFHDELFESIPDYCSYIID